jgi:thiamine monophosphate synthase
MQFAARCREAGASVLLSCTVQEIQRHRLSAAQLVAAGIDGVQVKGDPGPDAFEAVSGALRDDFIIGRSMHGTVPPEEDVPWSYTALAPIFDLSPSTGDKPGVGIGTDALRRWCDRVPRVFALGGVGREEIVPCLAAGAIGIAGIRLFFGEPADVVDNMAALAHAIDASTPRDHS